MFAEIKDNALIKFPYTFANLNEDNPYTNFKSTDLLTAYQGTNANVSGNTLINVVIEDQPTFDLSSEICTKNTQPTLINNVCF